MYFYIWNTQCINLLWLSQALLLKSRALPSALFRELGRSLTGRSCILALLTAHSGYVAVVSGDQGWLIK